MKKKVMNFFVILLGVLGVLSGPSVYAATALCNVDVKNHGATGDAQTDDTSNIQAAINAAALLENPTICFPGSAGYRVTDTITIPACISVTMDSALLFDGDNSKPALVIGDAQTRNRNVLLQLDVQKVSPLDWSNEASVGVRLYNLHSSKAHIRRVEFFTIGIQAIGANGKGFGYNEVELGWITGNKIGLDLTNESSGWANENVFINGRFGQYTTPSIATDRIGIRITSSDGSYKNNNNNVFIKPAFELWDQYAGNGEALPVLIEHGTFNRFESCRNESNSTTFARILNASKSNEFDVGYGGVGQIDDKTNRPSSVALAREDRIVSLSGAPAFLSGPLAKLAAPYDVSGAVHIPGVHATDVNASVLKAMSGFVIGDDYVEMPWPTGIGVFVDTGEQKELVIRKEAVTGFGGRVAIRAFDSAGQLLDGTSANPAYVRSNQSFSWRTIFSGAYYLDYDFGGDLYLNLRPEVARVNILFVGGSTNPLRIKSFSINALNSGAPSVWPGYKSAVPNANISLVAPTHACEVGQITFNAAPAVGEPVGWVCTVNTGTWSNFGTIN